MEASVGNLGSDCFAWTPIEKIGGRGKSFSPKLRRKMGMKHESAHCVVDGTNSTLSLAVLLRCVRTREA